MTQCRSVLGPRCGFRPVCSGHEQGLDRAWFTAGSEIWAQECLSGLERGLDPAWFSAGTEMRVKDYLSGA